MNKIRKFESGATRNSDIGKLDYEGFNHPLVDWSFAKYMHKHRKQEDGSLRDSDNWQKGIPVKELMKSLVRHTQDIKLIYRGIIVKEKGEIVSLEEALNGAKFNINALILSLLNNNNGIIERNERD